MIGVGMIALAMALTFGFWCWRDDRRAERAETRAMHERTERSFDRMQALIREARKSADPFRDAPRMPFPTEGDNFTTLPDASVLRPEFGKKPRTDTPDGVA